jgi:beta-carotene hydroxylase
VPSSHQTAHSDDLREFKRLTQRVKIAWPTVALFAGATAGALLGHIGLPFAMAVNAAALYGYFTVLHDASHRSVAVNETLNDWIGKIAAYWLSPFGMFDLFRWCHMQHHRFANSLQDPDRYTGIGRWSLPLRWLTFDFYQVGYFFMHARDRLDRIKSEVVTGATLTIALFAAAGMTGHFWGLLLLWLLPARIAIFVLVLTFDFLPHHPHETTQQENPYRATSIRAGMEWLLTPLLLCQNYHLVHHLYPTVPFYRYLAVWESRKAFHLAHKPAMVDAFGLTPKNIPDDHRA